MVAYGSSCCCVAACICINIYLFIFFYIGVCFYNLFKKPRTRMKAYINIVFRIMCVCVCIVDVQIGSVWMVLLCMFTVSLCVKCVPSNIARVSIAGFHP